MPNRQVNRKQIALVHIAKAQLGLSDEVYHEMLGSVGVLSSVQLTEDGFNELMRRFEAGGFRTTSAKMQRRKPRGHVGAPAPDRAPLLGKIEALLADMGLPWSYADGIAKRMWGTDQVAWCSPSQLRAVVAALVKRQKKPGAGNEPQEGRKRGVYLAPLAPPCG